MNLQYFKMMLRIFNTLFLGIISLQLVVLNEKLPDIDNNIHDIKFNLRYITELIEVKNSKDN
uniref:Uncharacterized protein n=1 Tax=viral metagenome TaxID=1070528 RepID=A0A6C0AYQ3_9ZZZZ